MFLQLLCIGVLFNGDGAASSYPRADLLMEAGDLAKPAISSRYHVIDARSHDDFVTAHIPHAVWVDESAWAQAFAKGQDRNDWQRRIGLLGIREDTPTVVYGVGSTTDAARIWWILHYWGLEDVRMLNGGWHAWTAAHLPVETGFTTPTAVDAHLQAQPSRLATKDQILAALKQHSFQILDARSDGEYCGTTRTARRTGAIPGAVHLEWLNVIDPKTKRFRSAEELAKLFRKSGVDLDATVVTHCQSGGRAAVLAFALELMGGKHVRNYYRSWAEWGNATDTPIVTPKPSR